MGAGLILTGVLLGLMFQASQKENQKWDMMAKAKGVPVGPYRDLRSRIDRLESSGGMTKTDREAADAYLKHPSPGIRGYAMTLVNFGLRKSDPGQVVEMATQMMDDPDENVRTQAFMLVYQRQPGSWKVYRSRIKSDPSESVRSLEKLFEDTDADRASEAGGGSL